MIFLILFFSSFTSLVSAEENESIECEILTDWGVTYIENVDIDGNFSTYDSDDNTSICSNLLSLLLEMDLLLI
jgi:hypothetical protein